MNLFSNQHAQLLIHYMRPQKGRVFLLVLLVLTTIGLQLVNPQIIRYFIDELSSGAALRKLFGAAALFIVMTVVRMIVLLAATYVGEVVGWTATNWLRADLAHHCLNLDLTFHKAHTPGELIERVDGDINELANFFSKLIVSLLGNLLLFFGILALLWWEGWLFGLSITLVACASYLTINYLRKRLVPLLETARASDAALFGFLEERLNGIEDIQTSGAKEYVLNHLYRLLRARSLAGKSPRYAARCLDHLHADLGLWACVCRRTSHWRNALSQQFYLHWHTLSALLLYQYH